MFFTECENLAKQHPDLAAAIQKIDAQFHEIRTAEVIRVDELASFLGLDTNQVSAILEFLAEAGILVSEEMVECAHCGMTVLGSDYEKVMKEDDKYRCTSCDRLWMGRRVQGITTYRCGEKWPEPLPDTAPAKQVGPEEEHPKIHCRIITHDGLEQLNKNQYESLISGKKTYDIFIDGFTRDVSHRGKVCSNLTAAEFEIMIEYIESKTTMRPFSTKTGSARSRDAAIKLFENARGKVDIKVGRYKFRAFQLHKSTDPKMKSFLFAPPKDMTYCLVIPIQQ